MSRRVSRRRFLLLGSTGLAIIAGIGVLRRWSRRDLDHVAQQLTGIVREHDAAIDIGQEYLRLFPHEREVGALIDEILGGRARPTGSSRELAQIVDRRMREDFSVGSTVRLRGWLLSRTEARLSALIALR